jgi:hypothetical protein
MWEALTKPCTKLKLKPLIKAYFFSAFVCHKPGCCIFATMKQLVILCSVNMITDPIVTKLRYKSKRQLFPHWARDKGTCQHIVNSHLVVSQSVLCRPNSCYSDLKTINDRWMVKLPSGSNNRSRNESPVSEVESRLQSSWFNHYQPRLHRDKRVRGEALIEERRRVVVGY